MEWNEPGGMPDRPQVELPPTMEGVRYIANEGLDYFERAGDKGDKLYVAAIRKLLAESEARAEGLVKLLREVSDWIDNWGPNFADDAEWQPVAERITAAIAAQREAGEA